MTNSILHIGICDDEMYWQEEIYKLCNAICENYRIPTQYHICSSGEELLQLKPPPDILFLDEEMNGISGQNIKEIYEISSYDTMIVFVTSHPEILYDSFGKNVYGFLNKPLKKSTFAKLFGKLLKKIRMTSYLEFFDSVAGNTRIPYKNIRYIKAEGSYSRICYNEADDVLIRKSLGDIEKTIVCEYMVRVHKSFIVNLIYCQKYQFDTYKLTMEDGTVIPIARRRKQCVQELSSKLAAERAAWFWNI